MTTPTVDMLSPGGSEPPVRAHEVMGEDPESEVVRATGVIS